MTAAAADQAGPRWIDDHPFRRVIPRARLKAAVELLLDPPKVRPLVVTYLVLTATDATVCWRWTDDHGDPISPELCCRVPYQDRD